MPGRVETTAVIAAHQLATAARGKIVLVFGAVFAALAIGIALAGLGASGQLIVQGFTRTAVSLLTLALYLLPLLGLLLGASAVGTEHGGVELLLAQPVGRGEVILGRTAGLAGALVVVATAGFGLAGALVMAQAGSEGMGGYTMSWLGATAVGIVGVMVGVLIGVLVRRRGAAVGWALAVWIAGAVLYDLASIAVLQLAGAGQPGPWLMAILALNPIDGVRAVSLVDLGADVLLGPTGAALQRMMGDDGGRLWVLASVAVWLALPLLIAVRRYARRDF